jgi:hypothetical protein
MWTHTTWLTSLVLSFRLWAVLLLLTEVYLLGFARWKKESHTTKGFYERRGRLRTAEGERNETDTHAANYRRGFTRWLLALREGRSGSGAHQNLVRESQGRHYRNGD